MPLMRCKRVRARGALSEMRLDALTRALALTLAVTLAALASGCGLGGSDLGAVFNATPDYPGYVWTHDGRPVTPEEFGTIAAPRHCEWQSATFLFTGWPPGTRTASSDQIRQYVRDPRGVLKGTFRDRLVLHATLPADARPTGYVYEMIQAYLSPSDQDEAIYLVGPVATERWPRSDPLTLCM